MPPDIPMEHERLLLLLHILQIRQDWMCYISGQPTYSRMESHKGYLLRNRSRAEGDKRTDTDQSGHQGCRSERVHSSTHFYFWLRQHFGEEDTRVSWVSKVVRMWRTALKHSHVGAE
jgi:hypothetical protein